MPRSNLIKSADGVVQRGNHPASGCTLGSPPDLGGQFLCLLFAVLCFSCVLAPSASAETRGQVAFGGVPVPGATVTASQGEKKFVAITDLIGMYVLPDLTEGTWTIEIEMLGFAKVSGDPSTSVW